MWCFFHVESDVGRNWTWAPAALTCLTRRFSKKSKKAMWRTHQSQEPVWRPCVCVCVGMLAGWYWLSVSHSPLLTSCTLTPLISCHVWCWESWYKQSADTKLHHTLSFKWASGAASSVRKHTTSCWSAVAGAFWSTLYMNLKKFQRCVRSLPLDSDVFWSQQPGYFSVFVNQWFRVFHGVLQHSLARQPLSGSWN